MFIQVLWSEAAKSESYSHSLQGGLVGVVMCFRFFARREYLGMELEYDVLLFRHNNLASTVPYTINERKKEMEVAGSSNPKLTTQESGGEGPRSLWRSKHLFVDPTKKSSYFGFFEIVHGISPLLVPIKK